MTERINVYNAGEPLLKEGIAKQFRKLCQNDD
jgi:hypothetical protein